MTYNDVKLQSDSHAAMAIPRMKLYKRYNSQEKKSGGTDSASVPNVNFFDQQIVAEEY